MTSISGVVFISIKGLGSGTEIKRAITVPFRYDVTSYHHNAARSKRKGGSGWNRPVLFSGKTA